MIFLFKWRKRKGILSKNDERRVMIVRTAFRYYGQVHREYMWLHIIYFCVLLVTSVFWFILPLYIFYYGQYQANVPLQLMLLGVLFLIPTVVVTLHCWFISFQAACKWAKQFPNESKWKWVLRFQAMAFFVASSFIVTIFTMMFFIDLIR